MCSCVITKFNFGPGLIYMRETDRGWPGSIIICFSEHTCTRVLFDMPHDPGPGYVAEGIFFFLALPFALSSAAAATPSRFTRNDARGNDDKRARPTLTATVCYNLHLKQQLVRFNWRRRACG